MKELKRSVEQVYGYEAIDGTYFEDKDECEKYDKSANAAAFAAAKKLVGKESCADTAFGMFCTCCEDQICIYHIKTADDLQVLNTYIKAKNTFNDIAGPEMIGHKVAVLESFDDYCAPLGSRAQLETKFSQLMDELFAEPEKEN